MPEGVADHLAAQLPREIGEHLRRTEIYGGTATGERFGRQEFIDWVSERAGAAPQQAAFIARAVTEVVDEATQNTLMAKVADSLPDDVRRLVTAGSTGNLSDG